MATHGPTSWLGHGVSESRSVLREPPGAQTGLWGPSGACLLRVPGHGSAEAQSLAAGPHSPRVEVNRKRLGLCPPGVCAARGPLPRSA